MQSRHKWIWQSLYWPAFSVDSRRLEGHLSVARLAQGQLIGKSEAIGMEGMQTHVADALTLEAITTSSIEGEKLDLQSVKSSVARRLGLDVSGAPVSEGRRNIEGLVDVLQDASTNIDTDLTLERLCGWHAALFPSGFSGMHRIQVGDLRNSPMEVVSGGIGNQKVHYRAPGAESLDSEMEVFLDWFRNSHPRTGSKPIDGLIRASLAHLWFETLHPFDDGNGRIGRAIMQLALGQDIGPAGRIVSLSRQIESVKSGYYTELERAQRSNAMDVTPWVSWMVQQISIATQYSCATIDASLQRMRFQASMSKFVLNERQQKTMQKLLDAGPRGFAGGMTTRKHQNITQTSTATAARDLIELEQLGLLSRQGAGRSVRYYPAIEGWAEEVGAMPSKTAQENSGSA